jgi:hypothetical protein
MELQRIQFRKIFFILFILLALSSLRCGGSGGGGNTTVESAGGKITLAWDSEINAEVASFKIYYSTASRYVSGSYEHSTDIGIGI